jgi:hypothetical protein
LTPHHTPPESHMRSPILLLCVGVVVIAAAWREPQVQPVVRKVMIRFSCDTAGAATVTVKPWRVVMLRRTEQVEWTLIPAGITSVSISPKYVAGWPFVAPPPLVVTAGKPGIGKDVPAAVPAGNYKYNITGICARTGAPSDTVVIDPDMIIPPI